MINVVEPLVRLTQVFLSSFLLLYAPGCTLSYCLFLPGSMDRTERAFISIAGSLAVNSLIAIALLKLPTGLNPEHFLFASTSTVVVFVAGACLRIKGSIEGSLDKRSFPTNLGQTLRQQRYHLALPLLSVVLLASLSVRTSLQGRTTGGVTEFYLMPSMIERLAQPGLSNREDLEIPVGLTNRTENTEEYRIEVRAGGEKIAEQAGIMLGPGERWGTSVLMQSSELTGLEILVLRLYARSSVVPLAELRLQLVQE